MTINAILEKWRCPCSITHIVKDTRLLFNDFVKEVNQVTDYIANVKHSINDRKYFGQESYPILNTLYFTS